MAHAERSAIEMDKYNTIQYMNQLGNVFVKEPASRSVINFL